MKALEVSDSSCSQALEIFPAADFAGLAAGFMPDGNVGLHASLKCTPGSVRVYGMQGGEALHQFWVNFAEFNN